MEKYINSPLFKHIEEQEVRKIIACTGAEACVFKKGNVIITSADEKPKLGIVLTGRVFAVRDDAFGNRCVISCIDKNEIFGLGVTVPDYIDDLFVIADDDSEVLLIDAKKLMWGCDNYCLAHRQLMYSLISLMSEKNLNLTNKLRHISQHSLRGKIISFLAEQGRKNRSREFNIPFDRQEMADYLAADRCAVSAELSKMKKDGLIDYKKNQFTLHGEIFNDMDI